MNVARIFCTTLTCVGWACAVYLAAVGSTHLEGPLALCVLARVLGFGSLVMVTQNIGSVLWDINT